MTIQRQQRAARKGTVRSFNLDASSLVRMAWCERYANEFLSDAKTTGSSIVRRALSLFHAHCESLLTAEGEDGNMRRSYEASQLRLANKGTFQIGLTVDQVRGVRELRPVHVLLKDQPRPLTVSEQLARDVQRWERQATEKAARHE